MNEDISYASEIDKLKAEFSEKERRYWRAGGLLIGLVLAMFALNILNQLDREPTHAPRGTVTQETP